MSKQVDIINDVITVPNNALALLHLTQSFW